MSEIEGSMRGLKVLLDSQFILDVPDLFFVCDRNAGFRRLKEVAENFTDSAYLWVRNQDIEPHCPFDYVGHNRNTPIVVSVKSGDYEGCEKRFLPNRCALLTLRRRVLRALYEFGPDNDDGEYDDISVLLDVDEEAGDCVLFIPHRGLHAGPLRLPLAGVRAAWEESEGLSLEIHNVSPKVIYILIAFDPGLFAAVRSGLNPGALEADFRRQMKVVTEEIQAMLCELDSVRLRYGLSIPVDARGWQYIHVYLTKFGHHHVLAWIQNCAQNDNSRIFALALFLHELVELAVYFWLHPLRRNNPLDLEGQYRGYLPGHAVALIVEHLFLQRVARQIPERPEFQRLRIAALVLRNPFADDLRLGSECQDQDLDMIRAAAREGWSYLPDYELADPTPGEIDTVDAFYQTIGATRLANEYWDDEDFWK